SGCVPTFRTGYERAVSPALAKGWRLADVRVNVPSNLVVSEAKSIFPRADIVWREDPPGDRRTQVARILADATRQAAAGMNGPQPVVIELTLRRFHALTFEAEARLSRSGVHDVEFDARVLDATTGAVLVPATRIEASLPALAGPAMVAARARGESQKLHISTHVRRVMAGWLGLGPDVRGSFTRLGG